MDTGLQWIPGHSDVQGNEGADQCAKEFAENKDRPPISLEADHSIINQKIKEANFDTNALVRSIQPTQKEKIGWK